MIGIIPVIVAIDVKSKKKNGLSWYKELGADKFFEKADGKRKKNG